LLHFAVVMERVHLIILSLLLYITLSTSKPPEGVRVPCIAVEGIDPLVEEDFDFRVPNWENSTVIYASENYNLPPMNGVYTYHYSFCDGINVYMGNIPQNPNNVFGWSYGVLSRFIAHDIDPRNASHEYSAFHQFTQVFSYGDSGAPCSEALPRSATVNVWCGLEKANCSQVVGAGDHCLNGETNPGFCLCLIQYPSNLCGGLLLHVLSNKCPHGRAKPIEPPSNPPDVSRVVGITFAFLGVFIMVSIIGGYIYNFTVHSKRGCQAIPFYDTCTGKKDDPTYVVNTGTSDTVTPPSGGSSSGYGSI